MPKILSTTDVITRAQAVHGTEYIYDKFAFVNAKTKCIIICRKHGEFLQYPNGHLSGSGCRKCWVERRRITKEIFESKANEVHKFKYGYANFKYVNARTKGFVTCFIHGDFLQRSSSHLEGNGCPECKANDQKLTKDEFIEEASKTHEFRYDYSKFDYQQSFIKGTIICKIHGAFAQTPSSHLQGTGCPRCGDIKNNPKWQRQVEEFITSIYKGSIVHNDRSTIKSKSSKRFRELDIYLPDIKLGIECHGSYFHNETHFPGVTKKDQEKFEMCKEIGVTLITVWENEWRDSNKRQLLEVLLRENITFQSNINTQPII